MKKKQIFITEEIPSKNKGEAAILIGFLESLKSLGMGDYGVSMLCMDRKNNNFEDRNVRILSYLENLDQKSKREAIFSGLIFTFKLTTFCLFYKLIGNSATNIFRDPVFSEFSTADILICGHDGIIEGLECTGNKFNKYLTYLFIFYHIILGKLFLKKKICILAASIGPFRNAFIRSLAKLSLSVVDLITVRDPKSYEYLRSLGINNNLYKTADFAYLMKPEKIIIPVLENRKKANLLAGFSISPEFYLFLKDSRVKETNSMKLERYLTMKAELLDYLVEKYNFDLVFIPHAIKKGKDDREVGNLIVHKLKNKNRCIFLDGDYSPEELKYIIGSCDLFIGERTHSNIAAASMFVPGISISEPRSHRNSMFRKLWGESNVIDINEIDSKIVKEAIDHIMINKDEIRSNLKLEIAEYERLALENGRLLKKLIDNG